MDLIEVLTNLKSANSENLNEADTRATYIDPVLESLGWTRSTIKREPYAGWFDSKGYIDYLLLVDERPMYVVEAKRTGRTFDIPGNLRRQRTTSYKKLRATASSDLLEALDQCLQYAQHTGALYACATNGLEWVFFKPNHPHRPLPEARVLLFSGVDDMLAGPAQDLLESILSYKGVEEGICEKELLGREVQVPSFAKRLRDAFPYHREMSIEEADYSNILDQMIFHYLLDLTNDNDFARCYVTVKGNRGTSDTIDTVISNQVELLGRRGSGEPGAFGTALVSQPGLPNVISGRTIVLHGPVGVGKSSFLRSCEASLKEAGRLQSAVWARVDLLTFRDRPFEISDVSSLLSMICTRIQESISSATQDMSGKYDPDVWIHLRDIYNQELRQFQRGRYPDSTDADQVYLDAAREFVWQLRSKDPQDHAVRVVRWLTANCRLSVVIVLDNSDQLGLEFQEFLYKLAETFRRTTSAITILVMRTEALESHRIREHAIASVAEQYYISKAPLPLVLTRRFELMEETMSAISSNNKDPQHQVAYERMSVLMDTIAYEANVGSDTFQIVDAVGNNSLRDALRAIAAIFRYSPRLMDRLVAATHSYASQPRLRPDRALRGILKEDRVSADPGKLLPNIFMVEPQVMVPYSLAIRMIQQIKSRSSIGEYTVGMLLNDMSIAGIDRGIAARVLSRLRSDRCVAVPHMLKEAREVDRLVVTRLGEVMIDIIIRHHDYCDAMAFDTVIYDRETYGRLRDTWNSTGDWSPKLLALGRIFFAAVRADDEMMRRSLTLSVLEPSVAAALPDVLST